MLSREDPRRLRVVFAISLAEGVLFAAEQFRIDWHAQQAMCPAGHTSISWTPAVDNRRTEVVKITCSAKHRHPCP